MPHAKVDTFLDSVCSQIRWPRARRKIRCELAAHIEDHIHYLMENRGYSYESAEETAVTAMGDPLEIGLALNAQHRIGARVLCVLITIAFWIAILSTLYFLVQGLC